MDYSAGKFWIDLFQCIWMVAATIWGLHIARHRASDSEIKSIDRKLDAFEENVEAKLNGFGTRLTRVEEEVRHLPTHNELGEVYGKLNEINAGTQSMAGELKAMRTQVEMLTKHLLDKH